MLKTVSKPLPFLLIVCIFLFMTACQQQSSDKQKRPLHINFLVGDLPSLHPHFFAGHLRGECLGKLLFECLTRSDANGNIQLTGAQSCDISPDGTRYLFTLRESTWSDGSPVTAFQYEASWKEALKPLSTSPRPDLFYVIKNAQEVKKGNLPLSEAGVKALDARTLSVELAFPLPAFLQFLSNPVFAPLQNPEEQPTHYNGAFVVDQWARESNLSLKKNPRFWNHSNVQFDTIEISFITDAMTAFHLYQKGELDWLGDPISSMSNEVIYTLVNNHQLYKKNSARVLWLPVNTQFPPLHSSAIRQALSLALDRDTINQHILIGNSIYTPLPPVLSLSSRTLDQNIELAQKLFKQGLQENGLTAETFPTLTLRFCNVPGMKEVATYACETWHKVFGITVQLQGTDWSTLISALTQGNFHIGCCYDKPYYLDALNILERFEFINSSNISRWTHPLFQKKVALARASSDIKQRNQWMQELEDTLADELPVIPISNQIQLYIHHPDLSGYAFDDAGYIDFSYAKLSKD